MGVEETIEAHETPCDDTGGECVWATEELGDDNWDLRCCNCNRYRDWTLMTYDDREIVTNETH